jgi:DNA-binding GntR family transcriptional regulator
VRDDRHLTRKPRRYRRAKSTGEFATEAQAAGLTPTIEATTSVVDAGADVANRLGIGPGAPIVRTAYRFLADGAPIQTSTSYEPHDLTAGTSIEVPEAGPLAGAGVIARFDDIGVHVDQVTEEVSVRPPRSTEVADLLIAKGVHVSSSAAPSSPKVAQSRPPTS